MSDRGLTGASSLAYQGVRPTTPPQLVINPRRPLPTDYLQFCIGDIWINNAGRALTPPVYPGPGDVYMLTSVAGNVATWIPMVGGLMSLDGDLGLPAFGDINSNIRIHSDIPNLDTTSFPALHRVTLSSTGGGALAEMFETDDHAVVVPNNAGLLFVSGADGVNTTGAGNVITIHGGGVTVATQYTTDNGVAVPAANNLNILAQHAALGCGSSVSFSAPGAASTVQLNVSDALTNTIIGNLAGNATLTGQHNTVLGVGAATGLTTSSDNTIIGYHAAQGLTTGASHIVIGSSAGSNLNAASVSNVIIGGVGVAGLTNFAYIGGTGGTFTAFHNYPGADATTVNGGNSFIGGAGNFTLTGSGTDASNDGFGSGCLNGLTSGTNNDAMGTFSLRLLTSGYSNVAIGHNAGYNSGANSGLTTGHDNVLLGYETGTNYTGAESNNVIIGANTYGVTGESNVTKIANIRGVTTNVADAIPVLIDSASQLGTISSSIRYKDNVEDMGADSDNVLNLRPVTFEYKKHLGVKQFGLIAEEVVEHMPRLVVFDSDGLPETVKYHELPAILLNEMQKLVKRIEQLEKNLQRYEEL